MTNQRSVYLNGNLGNCFDTDGWADDHVAVTCLDDFRQVLDSLLILDLGDNPDVLPLVTKNLSVNMYKFVIGFQIL